MYLTVCAKFVKLTTRGLLRNYNKVREYGGISATAKVQGKTVNSVMK